MPTLSRYVHFETHHSPPVQSGGASITPVSQALILDLGPLAAVWNRPIAVLVEQGETRRRLPIFDPTGLMLAGLAALIVAATVFSMTRRRKR